MYTPVNPSKDKRRLREATRVNLHCLVLPSTMKFLRAQKCSQGKAVDQAVIVLAGFQALAQFEKPSLKAKALTKS